MNARAQRTFFVATAAVCGLAATHAAHAVAIASENFDGGAVNLVSSDLPDTSTQTTGGQFFGVGQVGSVNPGDETWPQGYPPGVPFVLADDGAVSVSGGRSGSAFPADDEGLFGQNRNVNDSFFAVSNNDTIPDNNASWTFGIAGATDLAINIDMGSHIDGDFAYPAGATLAFTAQIDGGPVQNLFSIAPTATPGGFAFRPMDVLASETPLNVLQVSGASAVTKTLAEGGVATDTILDKSTVAGGLLDTYSTPITGTGSQLVLTFTGTLDFEGYGFDNIVISGVPEPTALAGLALGGLFLGRRRRV